MKTVGAWSSRAVLALLLGGCSLAALDGYSNGGANGQDAGEPSSDAGSSIDGSLEARAEPALDGGSEAAAPFCASRSPQPALCLDFDSDPAFGTWIVGSDKGGMVEASSAAFVSAPRAGFFSRTTVSGSAARMGLRYTLAGSRPDEIVLAADVRIDQIDNNQEMDFFSVVFPSIVSGEEAELQLSVADGQFQIEDWSYPADGGDSHDVESFQRAVTLTKWVHLELELHLSAPSYAKLTIDGVAAPQIPVTLPSGLGAPTIGLGDDYLVGGPYALYMDNFTATVR